MDILTALFGFSGRLTVRRFAAIITADALIVASLGTLARAGFSAPPGSPEYRFGLLLYILVLLALAWMPISLLVRTARALFVPIPPAAAPAQGFAPVGRPEFPPDFRAAANLPAARARRPARLALMLALAVCAFGLRVARTQIHTQIHTHAALDDESLANAAAYDARLIPVLLARAQAGDKSAMYFYGSMFDPGNCFYTPSIAQKDSTVAVYWYQKAVALDDQGAERNLGIDYDEGAGVPQDYAKAAALLEQTAAKNDDYGDYYLGFMLERGQGEPQDIPRALTLEQAAAAQGFAAADTELGDMYLNGIGVAPSQAQAAYYWNIAAAKGDKRAQARLAQYH